MVVAFKTFGCRLNQAETAQFEAAFAAANFKCVKFGQSADVVVVHSCAVTKSAEDEALRVLRSLRGKWSEALLVAVGCAVEAGGRERLLEMGLDLVVPREEKGQLVDQVLGLLGLPSGGEGEPPPLRNTHRALLKVQDGCNFNCAYCIIPSTRGEPVSVGLEEGVARCGRLIEAGYAEIVVTGCNLACYNDGGKRLPELLRALLGLPGLGRLRLGSVEPGLVEQEIVDLMVVEPKLCRFLHLPIQSGSDRVLGQMRRRYSVGEIRGSLELALEKLPDLALSADFICGFPGESEEEFGATLELVEGVGFSNLHVFPYSERPGTLAAEMGGEVAREVRTRRTRELIAAGAVGRRRYAERFVGREVELVVERFDGEGRARGWSCRGGLVIATPSRLLFNTACRGGCNDEIKQR